MNNGSNDEKQSMDDSVVAEGNNGGGEGGSRHPHHHPVAGHEGAASDGDADRHTRVRNTEAQLAEIEDEIRSHQPLTSARLPIATLVRSYETTTTTGDDGHFLRGARYLAGRYAHLRKVRGDGSCYYRAFLYAVCESLVRDTRHGEAERTRLHALVAESLVQRASQHGYDPGALDMFHEELVDLLASLPPQREETVDDALARLHATLTEENGTSEYCTFYLRVLTACHLKSDPDRFRNFLDHGDDDQQHGDDDDLHAFCKKEVEPMNKECGMVQVIALAEALAVHVRIEYLDGRDFPSARGLTLHEFGPARNTTAAGGRTTTVTLLYRPGHYDILYSDP